TVPDRGPNGEPTDVDGDGEDERPFALPDYQAQIVHFEFDPATKAFFITEQLPLVGEDGLTPITGLPNIPEVDEEPVDLFGNLLPYDDFGADMEGVLRAQNGDYWLVDEYRPSIYHFGADGVLINRFVPEGAGALGGFPAGTYGTEALPAEYSNRRRNRGFEAVAFDPQTPTLYAFIQTPLANPDRAASDGSDVIRILAFDPVAGEPVGEYVYLLEAPDHRDAKVDKMGDAVWTGGGRMHVIERDSSVGPTGKKYIFEIDLKGATNLRAPGAPGLMAGKTLEQHTADDLAALGIQPVHKTKVGNLPSLGYRAGDKPEGLALLPGGRLAVLNDNDFDLFDGAIAGDGTVPTNPFPVPVQLAILTPGEGNQLDASDRDDTINIRNWPILGQFMPDAVDSFPALNRHWFITANEGDARSEDDRVGDFVLDPTVFPRAAELQENENLGRYEASTIQGDFDGDGDYDRIYGYGARSATIWDEFGNLLWDSSDDVAWVTALANPGFFNASNDENGFDSRSDAKGAEPEAVETGWFFGRRYAFLGLERVGGVMVYDITNPFEVFFVDYLNTRDFFGDPEADTAGDLGPEGIFYIRRLTDEGRAPALVVTHEVSG
ncbi:MAG: esterase-like activity of phytase family protein, partial [Acidobacteriota bacterium]